MAIIFSDNFEDGTHDAWESAGAANHDIVNPSTPTNYGLNGSYCLDFYQYGSVKKTLTSSVGEIWVEFETSIGANYVPNHIILFYDSDNTLIAELRTQDATKIDFRIGGSAVKTANFAVAARPTTQSWLVHYKPLNSGGVFELTVDGTLVDTYSGDTTAGLENIKYVQFGGAAAWAWYAIDDVVFSDEEPSSDPAASGGIVFGGEVLEVATSIYADPAASGGIVFGSEETSADENHLVDGTSSGGIVFGGESTEKWQAEPNDWVAVKGGTYRIGGTIYTLAATMTYEGLGSIAALVDCGAAPAVAGTYRYDLLSVDAAGTMTVTAGTEAAIPVMPSTPSNEVKLDHVLRHYGQESIVQGDIGKLYTAPTLTTITAVVTDDELAWAELTTTITLTFRDQYGALYTGAKTITASFLRGNGTIAPTSKSGSGSSFTFTYTRGGANPGDESPAIQFASPTGPSAIAQITLLDSSGDPMFPS